MPKPKVFSPSSSKRNFCKSTIHPSRPRNVKPCGRPPLASRGTGCRDTFPKMSAGDLLTSDLELVEREVRERPIERRGPATQDLRAPLNELANGFPYCVM